MKCSTEPWIPITDDFMFNRVMRRETICRGLLQVILPEIAVGRIHYLETQKSMEALEARGIRMDVYARDERRVYNVELQRANREDLVKRSRYYQGHIDRGLLDKGEDYGKLRESYVIFICTFDAFGDGECIYHFENLSLKNPGRPLEDGAHKIFINTKGRRKGVAPALRAVLDYFEGKVSGETTDLVAQMRLEVKAANEDSKWRRTMMTFEMKLRDERRQGWKAGLEEGKLQGIEKGRREEKVSTARQMLKLGCDVHFIAEATGISPEKIETLTQKTDSGTQ